MKKLLILTLIAALATSATVAFAAETENEASNSVLAQVQANKSANKEKASEKAPQKEEAKKDEPKKSEAANAVDKIVKEEAAKASKDKPAAVKAPAVQKTEQPAKQTETKKPAVKTVEIPKAGTAAAPAASTTPATKEPVKVKPALSTESKAETKPAQTATKPAAPAPTVQITAPSQPAVSAPAQPAETPSIAGRPIKPSPMEAGAPETAATLIVTAEWLKTNRANVILIDARPESLYVGGHIPGAVNAPWTYFANLSAKQGTEKWGVMWPAATMAKRIGALGVNGKKTVVAYADAGGWGQGGYVIWILRQAGIKNAKVLQGGIGAWKAAGGQMTKARQSNKPIAFSITKYSTPYTVSTEWINNNIGKPGLVIIDVRTEPEYLGKIRPFQEKRAGHLPGAVNIPREAFINDDSSFKTPDEVAALLGQHGINRDCEIVVYDTAGVRAAFVMMVLRYCDFLKSANYDAGFQAWAGDPSLPLIKP